MLNKGIYLSEIERIMDIRNEGRGNWCYFAVQVKGGAQIAVCGEKETKHRVLEGELFFGKNLVSMENEAHELNRVRLDMESDRSAELVAKYLALATFN